MIYESVFPCRIYRLCEFSKKFQLYIKLLVFLALTQFIFMQVFFAVGYFQVFSNAKSNFFPFCNKTMILHLHCYQNTQAQKDVKQLRVGNSQKCIPSCRCISWHEACTFQIDLKSSPNFLGQYEYYEVLEGTLQVIFRLVK